MSSSTVATILANREGGTLKLDGLPLPEVGYFVGGLIPALVVPHDESAESEIEDFLLDAGTAPGVDFLGWWTDSEDGRLWVDGSDWHLLRTDALRVAAERGEIAIYDIAGQAEIRV
ncbi:MAG TPA: hypothetical protein VJQ57_13640 [Acidimicrobiia bacterium]|nr:hypothetical protein [Acidimicrobiia bacterium]